MAQRKKIIKKPIKKPLEFMQKVVIVMLIISVIFTSSSYILALLDKNPVEQLSIEMIRMLWAADGAGIVAYAWQNCTRAKWFGDKTANKSEEEQNNDLKC